MTYAPEYRRGRLSAPVSQAGMGVSLSHDLIKTLRAIRRENDEAMASIEQGDPDFEAKLSACVHPAQATALLDDWLARRLAVLRTTQARLRAAWQTLTIPAEHADRSSLR